MVATARPDVGPDFYGSDYVHEHDHARLTGQLLRVYEVMRDGQWRTLDEIRAITGDLDASISKQLRHLRMEKFGAFTVDKRVRGDRSRGIWEYRVGDKGTHEPKRHPLLERALVAEAKVRMLTRVIEQLDPTHPILEVVKVG